MRTVSSDGWLVVEPIVTESFCWGKLLFKFQLLALFQQVSVVPVQVKFLLKEICDKRHIIDMQRRLM